MNIPADVPQLSIAQYIDNYNNITYSTNRLMLFAADQKIEHLNKDFYGMSIHSDSNNPVHIFNIAANGNIGALASHFGLIARYGNLFPHINYIIKLNGKTNLIDIEQQEPISRQLWTIDQVINLQKNSGLKIRGVGYTIYLGSEFESIMLQEASNIVYQAHQHGLIVILWIYPRGKSIKNKSGIDLAAGCAGLANSLGADFAKIKPPYDFMSSLNMGEVLRIATQAAGNTKILCSGGQAKHPKEFLIELYEQISVGNTSGNATGRNIFQRSVPEAIALTQAISSIVYHNNNAQEAYNIYKSNI